MEKSQKVIIVTGSNKGIGKATVEALIERNCNFRVILTSRKILDGQEAVTNIKSAHHGKEIRLSHVQLDLLSDESIHLFVETILREFGIGSVQVLINNAGLYQQVSEDQLNSKVWNTNYVQTRKLTEKLLAANALGSSAKIINVTSCMGSIECLKNCNPLMYARFRDYKTLTVQELDSYAHTMRSEFIEGTETRKNWPRVMYSCSKLWANLWTSALGREIGNYGYPNIQVYSVHPGWVLTDMNRHELD